MADKRVQKVFDRAGNLMYEGTSPSLKSFVEMLVAQGQSMVRVDLRHRDLSGLDLNSVDFTEAWLDGADLRGMSARDGKFISASMKGVTAQGMLAERAQFQGADLGRDFDVASRHYSQRDETSVRSRFEGARLTFANFSGAILDQVVFDGAAMSRVLLYQASGNGASFRDTRLYDAGFSFSRFVNCDFTDAKLATTTQIAAAHLPDRTAWMTVANCRFDGAEMDATVPAFSRDHIWSKALKAMAYTVSSAAIFTGMHHLHLGDDASVFGDLIKGGTAVVLATTGLVVAKDIFAERVRDFVEDHLVDVDKALRQLGERVLREGANLKEMVLASLHGPGVAAVCHALKRTSGEAKRHGFFSQFLSAKSGGSATMIFADRRHLALALEALCAGVTRHRMMGDMVLVRADAATDAPSLIRYKVDGGVSMAWTRGGKVIGAADYARDGSLLRADPDVPAAATAEVHFRGFEEEIKRQHGVSLDYNRDTHELRTGQDGSILVMNKSTRRLSNPRDAALIRPDGSKLWFRNGKSGEDDRSHPGGTPPADPPAASMPAFSPS